MKSKQLIGQITMIPWGHNIIILSKCASIRESAFYVRKTIGNNWSRAVLTHQIESGLYQRNGKALSNFESTLPLPQSDLASEMLKDLYYFNSHYIAY